MDVKEAAKKAAAYTADMETLTKPDEKALFKTVTISNEDGSVISYE